MLERYYGHLEDVRGEYHKVELTPYGLKDILCYHGCCEILMNHAREQCETPMMKWAEENSLDQKVYIKMRDFVGDHGHHILQYRIINYMKPQDVIFWQLKFFYAQ